MSEVQEAVASGVRGWGDLRPEVKAMAILMEHELRKNDHKGGWKGDDIRGLMDHLRDEVAELAHVADPRIAPYVPKEARGVLEGPGSEAADVANMALMVADNAGALDLGAIPVG